MTPLPTSTFWLQTLASLALQTAAVLAVAGLASRLLRTPRSQRATWVA